MQMLYRSIGILCLVFGLNFCYKAAPSTSNNKSTPANSPTPVMPQPTLSVTGGTYNQPANVAINAAVMNATVCYTLNGSAPACDGNQKCAIGSTVPSGWTIQVSTATLRVLTCAAGYASSPVITQTYALDQVPPVNVSFFTATPGNKLIQLSWSNPGSDFSGVTIVRKQGSAPTSLSDGSVVYTGTGTSLTQTNLTNGTAYYYAAYSVDAAGNYSTGAGANTTPFDPPPGNVSVTNFSYASGMATMTWVNPTDADFAGVRVIRKTGGSPSGPGDGSIVLQGLGTTYTNTYLTNGYTHCYGFYPYDTLGSYATGVVYCAYPGLSYPSVWNFSGGNQQVSFNWSASSTSNSAGIRVVRKTGGYPTSIYDGSVVMNQSAAPSSSGTFTDTSVTNGTAYYYAAYAYDNYSNYSISYTGNAIPRMPAVTSFGATSGYNQVSLSWVNPTAANFQQVKLLRKTTGYPANPSDGTVIYTGTGTAIVDSNLPSGALQYYVIFVYDTMGVYSNWSYQTGTPTALNNVTAFTALADVNQINLTWTNPGDANFTQVKIVRKTGSFPANPTDGTTVYSGTGTSYSDTGLASGVTQYYKAFSTDCCSGASSGATASATPSPLADVTGLTATPGARQVTLNWTNPVSGALAGIRVVRKLGSPPTTPTDGTIAYNGTANLYVDTGLTNDQAQYYRIFSYDNYGAFSSGVTLSTAAAPPNEIVTGWNKNLYVTGLSPAAMRVDSSGNVYVVGSGYNLVNGTSGIDWYVRKFDSNGVEDSVNWNKKFNSVSTQTDYGQALAIDASNNVYAAGTQSGSYAWWIKKFSPSGFEDSVNWNKVINGISGRPRAMATDAAGNLYIVGEGMNQVGINSYYDWVIKKFSASGVEDLAWNKRYSGSLGSGDDGAQAIAIDPAGYVYVVGYGDNVVTAASRGDWWIKKFDFGGNEITSNWDKRLSSADYSWERAQAVLVDGAGDVYVSGYWNENSSGNNERWMIKKYSAAGIEDAVNWNKLFSSTTSGTALAADAAGNVYAVGWTLYYFSGTSYDDWYLRKFSPTGIEDILNWDRKFDLSLGSDPIYSIAIDPAGKIYVGGNYLKKFNP